VTIVQHLHIPTFAIEMQLAKSDRVSVLEGL